MKGNTNFNVKKEIVLKQNKNERGAGRKITNESNELSNKQFVFYLTETEAKKFKEYKEKNKLGYSSFIGSLLRGKRVFE